MLGQEVVRATGGEAISRAELDVTDSRAVSGVIGPGDLVINCAAWTDVDGAEEHPGEALRVNAEGAGNVARAAGAVAYVSSDYVFDGLKREPYLESDPVRPLSSYGRSKLEGERATAAANPRHFIVRSAWLFGPGGRNFVDTMLRLGPELRVVDDQVGCPTFTGHLADGTGSARQGRGLRRPPHGGVRQLLVVRVRRRDLRAGRPRRAAHALHDRGVPAAGPAARVVGAGKRARSPAAALA